MKCTTIILLALTSMLFFSCDKVDSISGSSNDLNPPNWLHGTWGDAKDNTLSYWIITSDDLVFKGSGVETSHKNMPSESSSEPINTSTKYRFIIKGKKVSGVQGEADYSFTKVSDTEITYLGALNVPITMYLQ